MRVSRSVVYVNVAMTMSTRPVVSAGSRAGVVTHVYVTRFALPNAKRENHLAISTSKPACWLLAPMYPNGGESHFTAMFNRFRSLMSAGSGGRPCLLGCERLGLTGRRYAALSATSAPAASATVASATMTRFIPFLLGRR